jgi:hypothetical protein
VFRRGSSSLPQGRSVHSEFTIVAHVDLARFSLPRYRVRFNLVPPFGDTHLSSPRSGTPILSSISPDLGHPPFPRLPSIWDTHPFLGFPRSGTPTFSPPAVSDFRPRLGTNRGLFGCLESTSLRNATLALTTPRSGTPTLSSASPDLGHPTILYIFVRTHV